MMGCHREKCIKFIHVISVPRESELPSVASKFSEHSIFNLFYSNIEL